MTSKNQLVFLALVLVLAVSQGPRNPWCSVYNDTTQLCSECYSGYFVRGNDCIFGNQYCNGFKNDGSGDCANCYHTDYNGPQCAYNPPVVNQPCYAGYYRAIPSGICTLGNPNCATFNDILGNGDCASCFHTDYNGPQCLYNPPVVNEPCYAGYYRAIPSGLCTLGNPNCATFNDILGNGDCASCFHTDYNGPQCLYNPPVVNEPCYAGYYRAIPSGLCTLGNPNCATFDDLLGNGDCASCYSGYSLTTNTPNINCVAIIIVAPTTDWYCNSRNGQNQCTGCYAGYYVNAPTSTPVNGAVCVPASPWCQNYVPVGGACNQCWSPYRPASPGSPLCVYP